MAVAIHGTGVSRNQLAELGGQWWSIEPRVACFGSPCGRLFGNSACFNLPSVFAGFLKRHSVFLFSLHSDLPSPLPPGPQLLSFPATKKEGHRGAPSLPVPDHLNTTALTGQHFASTETRMQVPLIRLQCGVNSYDWGKKGQSSAAARFAAATPSSELSIQEDQPYAEARVPILPHIRQHPPLLGSTPLT